MAQTFDLPAIGDTMVEGEIVEWFVSVGDTVELDQLVCSLETDKSVVELTTPYRGTVLALGGEPGDVIEVGKPLIVVGEPGEIGAAGTIVAAGESVPGRAGAEGSAGTPPDSHASAENEPRAESAGMAQLTSPLIRRLAEASGVDLAGVAGTGPGGRITRADVQAAQAVPKTAPAAAEQAVAAGAGPVLAMPKVRRQARARGIDLAALSGSGPRGSISTGDLDAAGAASEPGQSRRPMSATRRSIAAHLSESVRTIPQFTAMVEADATALLATRAALRDRIGSEVPLDAVLTALLIPVLRDHPVVNACLDGDEIVLRERCHIGLAVDTPEGLMLPVVRDADRLGFADLNAEIVRLAAAARERTIRPDELSGATCTVNNVGAVGIVAGTPILPLGTSAIVAFGAARPQVRLLDGNPLETPTMTISATFDHRLIDGGDSGRFLTQLKKHLEVPALGLF